MRAGADFAELEHGPGRAVTTLVLHSYGDGESRISREERAGADLHVELTDYSPNVDESQFASTR